MNRNTGDLDGLTVQWWWTASCGGLHVEDNPVVIERYCPFDFETMESKADAD